MDTRDEDETEVMRRDAYRAAQKSTSNVFRFRRLKWAVLPIELGQTHLRRPIVSIAGLLILLIIASIMGYVAISVWPVVLAALA